MKHGRDQRAFKKLDTRLCWDDIPRSPNVKKNITGNTKDLCFVAHRTIEYFIPSQSVMSCGNVNRSLSGAGAALTQYIIF